MDDFSDNNSLYDTQSHKEEEYQTKIASGEIPLSAGFPSPASDYVQHELDFNKLLISNPSTTFCLQVAGNSMSRAGIHHKDIVVIDKLLEPRPNDIVIVVIDGEFLLKRYVHERGMQILRSESDEIYDIEIKGVMDIHIFGVVCSVIKRLR